MRYVLFVCTHNAGRSQMAEAFFNRDGPADVRAESAGEQPAHEVWPEVVAAMAEVGIDLAGRRPTKLLHEMQLHADWAVTLACGAQCPYVPATVEDWDIPDPAGRPLEEVRAIRDAIQLRIIDLLETRIDAIRGDRTAHQARLARLLPSLAADFEDSHTPEEIRACADAILAQFSEVPIRSHVMTLADRRARECLAAPTCAVLAVA